MKKSILFLLALILTFPLSALANQTISLEGLMLNELEALRQEADGRIRLMQLSDENGYLDVLDGEAYARDPQTRLGEKIRLSGVILSVQEQVEGFLYYVSLDGNPERVFLVRYTVKEGERLILPGDQVTAYGVFEGLSAFEGAAVLKDGAPIVRADLVIQSLLRPKRLVADPYAGTREDPAPLGVIAVYEGSYWTDYASFEIEITSSTRGKNAKKIAQDMSTYNINPTRAQEYFLVWLRVKALSAPTGRAEISNEDFYFVSTGGREYRQHFLINPPTYLRTLYEGGEQTAVIACLIDKEDTPLIVYQPDSANPLWFNPNP